MTSTHPYSGASPVPRIKDFLKEREHRKAEHLTSADGDFGVDAQQSTNADDGHAQAGATQNSGGKREKITKESQHPTAKDQTKIFKHGLRSGEGNQRVVRDPITRKDVVIEDVTGDFKKEAENPELVVPNVNLPGRPANESDFSGPTQSIEEYAKKQDVTAPPAPMKPHTTTDVPIRGEKTNILFHPTPTLSLTDTVFASFEEKAGYLCVGIFVAILGLGKILGGGSIWALLLVASAVTGGVWYWCKGLMDEARAVDWDSEKKRGEIAVSNLIPESVEWMNTLVGLVWGLVNPDMLSSIADTIEDVMQASLPGFIENVRIAEMSQGSNPIRILSLRALPDSEVPNLKKAATTGNSGRDELEKKAREDGGEVYNLEVSFAYNAAPVDTKGISGKTRNMHMEVIFYAGIRGLFGVPLPIWVDLKGLTGTVRLRLQITPNPPYLNDLTFTLMGIPQISVACTPMAEKGINVLNLPMISNFVNAAIATAANEYVAPKCMSMEIGKMLLGDDVKKETEALGVLWVNIDKAVGLKAQDRSGGSDSYITLAFSKYGKPMYSTRVICGDLNPVWHESTGILIRSEHIKAKESLSIELWDSDRLTADDLIGKCEVSIQDLMMKPGEMHQKVSKLSGERHDSVMPGDLYWSVGYFGKPNLRPALRTSGKDVNLPEELQNLPELQDDKGRLDNADEDAIMHTPPDPLFPSGIVSVIVHQIVNLEVKDRTGTYYKRKNGKEYSPGQKTGENTQEEGGKLPSSYCTIALNDQLIYRTRCKVLSSKPIFNAGTERFIRDWRSAIVTVAVRDQRHREHDPLLGVVPLKLSELLLTSSEVTRWFPLDCGLGYGQIRISLLFRSIDLTLPPELLGWDIGTVEFVGEKITSTIDKVSKLKFRTGGSTGKLPRKNCTALDTATGVEWNTIIGSKNPHKLRLPVQHRYMSPLTIDIYTASSSRKPDAHAMLWLNKLIDNEIKTVNIPIWKTTDPQKLTQNYIEKSGDHPDIDLEEIGTISFACKFQPGMDCDHEPFATDNDVREMFETWDACRGDGIRGDTVYAETNPVVDRLHQESVKQMRHDLAETDKLGGVDALSDDDSKRYTDKYGVNWKDVFESAHVQLGDASTRSATVANRRQSPHRSPYKWDSDTDDSSSPEDSDLDDSDNSYQHVTSSQYHEQSPPPAITAAAATTDREEPAKSTHTGPLASLKNYRENRRSLHSRQRGLMQWKPIRSLAFAKDEAKFGVRKLRNKVKLSGRHPDVETEA